MSWFPRSKVPLSYDQNWKRLANDLYLFPSLLSYLFQRTCTCIFVFLCSIIQTSQKTVQNQSQPSNVSNRRHIRNRNALCSRLTLNSMCASSCCFVLICLQLIFILHGSILDIFQKIQTNSKSSMDFSFVLLINEGNKNVWKNSNEHFECISQAQFDEYREKIAALEKELLEAKANKPSEEETNALKHKIEGIQINLHFNHSFSLPNRFLPQNLQNCKLITTRSCRRSLNYRLNAKNYQKNVNRWRRKKRKLKSLAI